MTWWIFHQNHRNGWKWIPDKKNEWKHKRNGKICTKYWTFVAVSGKHVHQKRVCRNLPYLKMLKETTGYCQSHNNSGIHAYKCKNSKQACLEGACLGTDKQQWQKHGKGSRKRVWMSHDVTVNDRRALVQKNRNKREIKNNYSGKCYKL